jgi:AcrR family transcriptional regulator
LKKSTHTRESVSKEKLISEAIALAKEVGWKKVTVRAITDRLNYKPPVLYQFFDNKDHLIQTILETGFETLNTSLKEARTSEADADGKLLAMARARFRFATDHPAMHSLMFTTDTPNWFRETVFTGMCQTREIVTSLIQEISGREDQCLDLVTNFISLIKGYTFFATELPADLAKSQFFGLKTPDEALAEAMKRFINSIQPNE